MTCSRLPLPACLGFLALVSVLSASHARAQIDRPGAHLRYSSEVDAHLVVQWDHQPAWHNEGIGLGVHVALPVVESGPVRTINNSLAVAFGLDWAHFGDRCELPGGPYEDRCAANDFWLPVVVQWNFYFSNTISAFPELGLAIEHTRWADGFCRFNGVYQRCNDGGSNTSVDLVFWLGVRFHIQDTFALTLRIGTPSLLLGAAFFL